ncbi:hypothetical protein ATANTOWER_017100, partial [Ataeniobius toweri]|nr:hypothetical protein [Ataeniobius toweri]
VSQTTGALCEAVNNVCLNVQIKTKLRDRRRQLLGFKTTIMTGPQRFHPFIHPYPLIFARLQDGLCLFLQSLDEVEYTLNRSPSQGSTETSKTYNEHVHSPL